MSVLSNPCSQLDRVLLSECFSYLTPSEHTNLCPVNKTWQIVSERTPILIKEGHFRSKLRHKDGVIFLHMELLTEENHKAWEIYKLWTRAINQDLAAIVHGITEKTDTYDEKTRKFLGFSDEKYKQFTQEIIELKKEKPNIEKVIAGISSGIMPLNTNPRPGNNYIVYVTTGSDPLLLPYVKSKPDYQQFTELYQSVIMSVGVNLNYKEEIHTDEKTIEITHFYENRGISVNSYWALKNKFKGLSPSLQTLTGIIAKLYFSQKKWLVTHPLSSMLAIFIKILQCGDGYTFVKSDTKGFIPDLRFKAHLSEKKDITDCHVSPDEGGEHPANYIKVDSLARIHFNKESSA